MTGTIDIPVTRIGRPALPRFAAFVATTGAFAALFFGAGAPTSLFVHLEQRWGFSPALLTVAFAAYSVGLLIALLFVGKLSDFTGRRPVLIAAFTAGLLSAALFLTATNIWLIIIARLVQGLAVGAATSAMTASIIELAPTRHKKLGTILSAIASPAGLAVGALVGGAAVQLLPRPSVAVFSVLIALMIAGLAAVALSPETIERRPGALATIAPRLTVPQAARREFSALVPALLGGWMFAALFLGLAPIIVRDVFLIDSGLVNGTTSFIEPAAAAIAGLVLGALSPRRLSLIGNAGVFIGAIATVAGIVVEIPVLFWVGGLIGGFGFGAVHSASLRLLTPLVAAHERAAVFTAVFVVGYIAFGVPAVVLGLLIAPLGLQLPAIAFAAAIALFALTGLIGRIMLDRR